jgi:hypothetical protein
VNCILGLVLNLHRLTVGAPPKFTATMADLLRTTWGPHHHSFPSFWARENKELTGKLNHIAFGAPWLKFLLGIIYSLLAAALWLNNSSSSGPADLSATPST